MWLLIELICVLCLYMATKWSAAFMAFPWSSSYAWSLQWKETQEFRLEKGPLLSQHLIRCSVVLKGKEATAPNELLSPSVCLSLKWGGSWEMLIILHDFIFLPFSETFSHDSLIIVILFWMHDILMDTSVQSNWEKEYKPTWASV